MRSLLSSTSILPLIRSKNLSLASAALLTILPPGHAILGASSCCAPSCCDTSVVFLGISCTSSASSVSYGSGTFGLTMSTMAYSFRSGPIATDLKACLLLACLCTSLTHSCPVSGSFVTSAPGKMAAMPRFFGPPTVRFSPFELNVAPDVDRSRSKMAAMLLLLSFCASCTIRSSMTMLSFAWIVSKYRFIASSCSLLHIDSSAVRLAAPFSAAAMAAKSFSNSAILSCARRRCAPSPPILGSIRLA